MNFDLKKKFDRLFQQISELERKRNKEISRHEFNLKEMIKKLSKMTKNQPKTMRNSEINSEDDIKKIHSL